MELELLPHRLTICKVPSIKDIRTDADFYFIGRTDAEISLVCRTEDAPAGAEARDDGWRAFRVRGPLDFSLTGILSGLSGILARNGIGIFAVSTFDTDYILVKEEHRERAAEALAGAGHAIS